MGLIKELERRGSLRRVAAMEVNSKTKELRDRNVCRSNDVHVLALAFVAGVRLLCSRDQDLHADFTNPKLLQPKGKVYQSATHTHLIGRHCKNRTVPSRQRQSGRN